MNQTTERYADLAGIQADLQWLYLSWQHIKDDDAYTGMSSDSVVLERLDKFHMRLESTAVSDVALRALYGFTGCVFAPKKCPTSNAMVCGGCREE
jgi:hypothetical protein